MPTDLVHLVGAGGHCRVVAEALRRNGTPADAIIVRDSRPGLVAYGRPVQTPEVDEAMAGHLFHVAIGSAVIRSRFHASALNVGARPLTIVHPGAWIAEDAKLGDAVLVAATAVIGPGVLVGDGTIINHGAIVDHDCSVGSFSHIAPNATLGGFAAIGARVLIGAGAVVLPGLTISSDVIVGAGAVVVRSIGEPGTWVGNPARKLVQ